MNVVDPENPHDGDIGHFPWPRTAASVRELICRCCRLLQEEILIEKQVWKKYRFSNEDLEPARESDDWSNRSKPRGARRIRDAVRRRELIQLRRSELLC